MQTLDEIFASQDDLITRRQSLHYLTESELRQMLGRRLGIVLPGVYSSTLADVTSRQRIRAGLLHAGFRAQVTDRTALGLYQLDYLPADDRIRVLVPADVQRVSRSFVRISRTIRPPAPVTIAGFPVAPAHRALAAFVARHGNLRDSLAVAAQAVQRRLVTRSQWCGEIAEGPARGRPRLRWVLEQLDAGIRSAPEYDVRELVLACPGLPEPLWNPLLRLPDGHLVSPDGFWIDSASAHEVDGRDRHSAELAGEDAFEDTYERRGWMEAAGVAVMASTPRQVRDPGKLVIRRIADCVKRNAGRGLPPGVEIVRWGPPPW